MIAKRIIWILLCICGFGVHSLLSQSGIRVGYSMGLGNAREINKLIYTYNTLNSSLIKEMPLFNAFGGLTIAYINESDGNTGFEMKWQNRHREMSSKWMDTGVEYQRDIKFRMNQLSFGGYGALNDYLYMGGSIDFGSFKGFTRKGPSESVSDTTYQQMFVRKDYHSLPFVRMQLSNTIFLGFRYKIFGARINFQWQYMNMPLDNMSRALLGVPIDSYRELKGKFTNIGLELYIKIGGEN